MRSWQVNLALNVGGAVRALLIGVGLLAVALPLTGVPIHAPLALVRGVFLLLVLFCSFGSWSASTPSRGTTRRS